MSLLSNLQPRSGSKHRTKRIGRGESSGWGKTSGRGHKGQKSRSSAHIPVGFEGGQMPLHRRSPKWGFNQLNRRLFHIVNLSDLNERFQKSEEVTPERLKEVRLIRDLKRPVKILAKGKLEHPLKISAHAFSDAAIKEIESAKGEVKKLEWKKKKEDAA